MTNLQERFESFIKTVRGFESIDELLKDVHLEGKKRADYLLWNRQIIVEQKVLVDDPADKPQKFANQLMNEGRFLFYGQVSTDRIFREYARRRRTEETDVSQHYEGTGGQLRRCR
jgi:hypothetical protein